MTERLSISGKTASMFQERLFSRLPLGQVLDIFHSRARSEFERNKDTGDNLLLVERLLERHRLEPLRLSREIDWINCFTHPDGEIEHQFSVEFSGTPLLWHLSPSPIEDVLPDGEKLTS